MQLDYRAFAFVIALAAVVNGLGLTRMLLGLAEYLRCKQRLEVTRSWLFTSWAMFQFLIHLLLWWQLWAIREASGFSFTTFLYLLTGPITLFLATSLLLPDVAEGRMNLTAHYGDVRRTFFAVSAFFWLWVLLIGPILLGGFTPAAPVLGAMFGLMVIMRLQENPRVHTAFTVVSWLLLGYYIMNFAIRFG